MALPERYSPQVEDIEKIWKPKGTFGAQARVYIAQAEARHDLYGEPTLPQIKEIKKALTLSKKDLNYLTVAKGHETIRFVELAQSRANISNEAAKYIHLGNTSSDILDTSLTLQIRDSLDIILYDHTKLTEVLKSLALTHQDTIQIGRSHGQHAIPQTFGRQVVGWYAEAKRGLRRLQNSKEIMNVGKLSGEVGTNVNISPELEELALAKLNLIPDEAPTQIISRDRHAEVLGNLAVNSTTLARIALNIRLLSMTELGEVREFFSGQGSSAMPHKRNPEISERVGGLTPKIGDLAQAELRANILWFERDMSHSAPERSTFEDAFGYLSYTTKLMINTLEGLIVYPDKMAENLNKTYGAIFSPRLLNILINKGIKREVAYKHVQRLSQSAMDQKTHLKEILSNDNELNQVLSEENLAEIFDLNYFLKNIKVAFQRTGLDKN